jgi:PAS domain S-box-containing protein
LQPLIEAIRAGGDTGRIILDYDWAATPLGPIEEWEAALRHAVAFMMPAQVPIVLLWGEPGTMIYNDAYSRFAGSRHPGLIGKPVREGWVEIADFNDHVVRTVLAGDTLHFRDRRFELQRGDTSSELWLDLDYSPIIGDAGAPSGVLAIVVETTERVLAERALKKNQDWLSSLIEGIPQLVWRSGPEGEWLASSPQWRAFTGLSEKQSLGLGWLEAIHPDDRDQVQRAWNQVVEGGTLSVDARIRNAVSQTYHWFTIRANPAGKGITGNRPEWLGTCTDIDELLRLQDRQRILLHELQHRVRNTLSIVRAIARKTAESADNFDDYVQHLDGRIAALARAQALVVRDPTGAIDLETMILDEMQTLGGGEQSTLDGPQIRLSAKAGELLNLAVHELATNALKYGSLARTEGHISITWYVQDIEEKTRLVIEWQESLPQPTIFSIAMEGFGVELLTRTLAYNLHATTTLEFRPSGLFCRISLPFEDVRASH